MATGSVKACEKKTTIHAMPRMPSSAGLRPRRREGRGRSGTPSSYQTSLRGNSDQAWDAPVPRMGIACESEHTPVVRRGGRPAGWICPVGRPGTGGDRGVRADRRCAARPGETRSAGAGSRPTRGRADRWRRRPRGWPASARLSSRPPGRLRRQPQARVALAQRVELGAELGPFALGDRAEASVAAEAGPRVA